MNHFTQKLRGKNCTSLLWNGSMATGQRSICFNSTEFTTEKHKSYFTTLSMFLISLELPKKLHHGTVLKWISSPYTEHTWLRWVLLFHRRKPVIWRQKQQYSLCLSISEQQQYNSYYEFCIHSAILRFEELQYIFFVTA